MSIEVKRYLAQLQSTLPKVPPISAGPLEALHAAGNYKGMVQSIKKLMSLHDITFHVFWMPDGMAQHKDRKECTGVGHVAETT